MFDLEQAISNWRRQMLAAGIKTPAPLEELENHLREDFEQQARSGSSTQQAFERCRPADRSNQHADNRVWQSWWNKGGNPDYSGQTAHHNWRAGCSVYDCGVLRPLVDTESRRRNRQIWRSCQRRLGEVEHAIIAIALPRSCVTTRFELRLPSWPKAEIPRQDCPGNYAVTNGLQMKEQYV